MSRAFQCLRPCLRSIWSHRRLRPTPLLPVHIRTYAGPTSDTHVKTLFASADARHRWIKLRAMNVSPYPRVPDFKHVTRLAEFVYRYRGLGAGETILTDKITICGMPKAKEESSKTHASRKDTIVSHSRPPPYISRRIPTRPQDTMRYQCQCNERCEREQIQKLLPPG